MTPQPLRDTCDCHLGRCWCGGQVRQEFGFCGRWGLWCQYGHKADELRVFDRPVRQAVTDYIGPPYPTAGSNR